MLDHCRLPTASTWTRLLLAMLALALVGLGVSGFLLAILSAAGDFAGRQACSAIAFGMAIVAAVACVALVTTIAVRLEFQKAPEA